MREGENKCEAIATVAVKKFIKRQTKSQDAFAQKNADINIGMQIA